MWGHPTAETEDDNTPVATLCLECGSDHCQRWYLQVEEDNIPVSNLCLEFWGQPITDIEEELVS